MLKITKEICQEFTDSDLKVHAFHYANELTQQAETMRKKR